MGILCKLPAGWGTGKLGSGLSVFAAWAIISAPGTVTASRPLVAAKNSLRPMAAFLGCFIMRLLGKRSNRVSPLCVGSIIRRCMASASRQIVILLNLMRNWGRADK